MRKIMFRGKCDDKWHFGDLLHAFYDNELVIEERDIRGCIIRNRIVPASVGQFTGLHDADGREIYEGDIVRVVHYGEESIHVIKYCDDMDYPAFDLDPHFDCESNGLSFCKCERETTITVIGNIHDNPSLLEAAHV